MIVMAHIPNALIDVQLRRDLVDYSIEFVDSLLASISTHNSSCSPNIGTTWPDHWLDATAFGHKSSHGLARSIEFNLVVDVCVCYNNLMNLAKTESFNWVFNNIICVAALLANFVKHYIIKTTK